MVMAPQSRMAPASKKRYQYLVHKCKYCCRRFTGTNGGYRLFSHLRHHELTIKPYWYRKSNLTNSKRMNMATEKKISFTPDKYLGRKRQSASQRMHARSTKPRLDLPIEKVDLTLRHTKTNSTAGTFSASDKDPTNKTGFNGHNKAISNEGENASSLLLDVDREHAKVGTAKSSTKRTRNRRKTSAGKENPEVTMVTLRQPPDTSSTKETTRQQARRFCDEKCQISASKTKDACAPSEKPKQKRYHCQYCPRCFSQNGGLVIHERIHLGERPFVCDICDATFYDKSYLKRHKRIHSGEKIYKCKICDKSFIESSSLKKHVDTHGAPKHKCEYCNRLFSAKQSLQKHERAHRGERPFSCSYCGTTFIRQQTMQRHVLSIHAKEKSHTCPYDNCDAAFTFRKQLTYHIRRHEGIKPFKCDLCERRFTMASQCNEHQAVHYGGFKCEYCPRAFGSKSGKAYHENVVHVQKGESPHVCKICGAKFKSPYKRNKHEERHQRKTSTATSNPDPMPAITDPMLSLPTSAHSRSTKASTSLTMSTNSTLLQPPINPKYQQATPTSTNATYLQATTSTNQKYLQPSPTSTKPIYMQATQMSTSSTSLKPSPMSTDSTSLQPSPMSTSSKSLQLPPKSTNSRYLNQASLSTNPQYLQPLPTSTNSMYLQSAPTSTNTKYLQSSPTSTNSMFLQPAPTSTNPRYLQQVPTSTITKYLQPTLTSLNPTYIQSTPTSTFGRLMRQVSLMQQSGSAIFNDHYQ
ncbi:uncharacterized protein [Amphiura filiformis]|uniref:uncharacterized protein n=1 Tax=Amphiura filiformis TaxID=82378 RepID=UPI003B21DF42